MWSRGARIALVAAPALAAVYWTVAVTSPHAVGIWQDDGIYVCTARSLAAGSGYRHIELATEPLHTCGRPGPVGRTGGTERSSGYRA